MLDRSLNLLACCLTIVSVFLTDQQQRDISILIVKAWATVSEFREYLKTKPMFEAVLRESPSATAVATVKCLVAGLFGMVIYAIISALGTNALISTLTADDNAMCAGSCSSIVMCLYSALLIGSVLRLFESLVQAIFSAWMIVAASILIALSIVDFLLRRLAEYEKGPVIAMNLLVVAAFSFLKAFI
jgi:hypothetical protein